MIFSKTEYRLEKRYLCLILLFILFVSPIAQASVIELDHLNTNHCRQQLITGTENQPIIFLYMFGCPWANKLRPLYEEVSNLLPDRAFFAFNFHDMFDSKNNARYLRTAIECLGIAPFRSPLVAIYNVVPIMSQQNNYGNIKGMTKLGLNGLATKEDIIEFIQDKKLKSLKTFTQI